MTAEQTSGCQEIFVSPFGAVGRNTRLINVRVNGAVNVSAVDGQTRFHSFLNASVETTVTNCSTGLNFYVD